mmetsp:Transcript_3866/g.8122  ORF Transcript_3866/g.8122 Transcript_3866/m.8122 type:complete len:276 (-) Transcript_3866:430-1257(-)
MNLYYLFYCRQDVVLHDAFRIECLDMESPARYAKDGRPAKEIAEPVGTQSGAGDDEFQIVSAGDDLAQDPEEHVGVEAPLVGLVHDDRRVHVQVGIAEGFAEQDAVSHIFDHRMFPGEVFEPDGVPDRSPQLLLLPLLPFLCDAGRDLFADAFGDTYGGHTSGLRAADDAVIGVALLHEVLGELGSLPAPRLPHDDHDGILPDDVQEFLPDGVHRKELALLPHGFGTGELGDGPHDGFTVSFIFDVRGKACRLFVIYLFALFLLLFIIFFTGPNG